MLLFNPKLESVDTFPKGISPKVNAIAQLEFELVYEDVEVQGVTHYVKFMKNIQL